MVRKQSLKSELLEEIRQRRKAIDKLMVKLHDKERLLSDLQNVIAKGVFSETRGLKFFDRQVLKAQARISSLKRQISNNESAIADMNQSAMQVSAEAVISAAAVAIGLVMVQPGWRWVTGFEEKYVWDERGRVASVKRNYVGDGWVLRILRGVKRGLYALTIEGGDTVTRSFSRIVQDGIEGAVVFSHLDHRPLSAVKVGDGSLATLDLSVSGRT